MRVLLIVNPRAGREKASARAQTLKKSLKLRGIGCDIRFTVGARDAEQFITQRTAIYDTIICLGGDGTLSETVNGMMRSEQKAKLLYLPTGTTNDFARGLGLSDNTASAIAAAIDGTSESLDVGRLNERYFIYSAAFGIFSVGGFLQIKQDDMSLNDGLHEVLLIRRPDSVGAFSMILSAVLRHDYTAQGIEFFHTSTLNCESTEPMEWALDGEQFSSDTTIRFQNCPSSVDILLPKSRRLAS